MVQESDEQNYFDLCYDIGCTKENKAVYICYVINNNVLPFKQRNAKILSAYLKSFLMACRICRLQNRRKERYKILKAEKLAEKIFLMDVEAPRVARSCSRVNLSL